MIADELWALADALADKADALEAAIAFARFRRASTITKRMLEAELDQCTVELAGALFAARAHGSQPRRGDLIH